MHITEKIDEMADSFETAWKAGNTPQVEAYLEDCPPEARLALLAELIRIDAAVRFRRGEVPELGAYLARFPELLPGSEVLRELDEYWSKLATVEGFSGSTDVAQAAGSAGPGETLREQRRIGRFVLLEQLGSGSFGTVWRAYDDHLERHVAVKLLRGAPFAGSEERPRFLREARSVAQLQHESIVAIHEAGEHDGIPYLVSELIRGQTLQERAVEHRFVTREAAALVIQVARALDYAHRKRIVHRDVKPSNILLDETGRPFITDFGLAKRTEADGIITADGQVMGTPAYMSPEQAAGHLDQADHRTDVYSLGVVLYELLTGERPFRGELRMLLMQVQNDEPRPPRRLDDRIPRDLETICLKAMAKEPSRRYQTAGELADDLERFLRGELIHARPVSSWTRWIRFSRRNWKIVVPSALAVIAMVTVVVTVFLARIAEANLQVAHAQQQEQAQRREVLVERLQRLRLRERTNGWSTRAETLIRAASDIRRDQDLRDFAAASLEGLDAVVRKEFRELSASAVAFDPEGRRLLIGGFDEQQAHLYFFEKPDGRPDDRLDPLGLPASGPVSIAPTGRMLQLALIHPQALSKHGLPAGRPLVLFDCEEGRAIRSFAVDTSDTLAAETQPVLTCLAPDGSRVAAAIPLGERRGIVVAWDAVTGAELIHWNHPASAIAFSPDGTFFAAGDTGGRVTLWQLPDGEPIAELHAVRNSITALAFQHNPRRTLVEVEPITWRDPWLLAAGDTGGTVTIWNPTQGVPVCFCRGAHHHVTAVAFSPDATLLAGGAHAEARIWDAATGQLLLRIDPNASRQGAALQRVSGLAFSPDGQRLAISSLGRWSPPVVTVLEIHDGRGIRTLRGLSAELAKIRFSSDDKYIAAFSHRWEIGVWRASDGRLLHIFDAPIGYMADNAGLVISPDGGRLAFSTYQDGRLWEIETGRLLASWKLPPGLQDELAFAPDGDLYLLRFESRSKDSLPRLTVDDPQADDVICRVRRLKLDGTLEEPPQFETDRFAKWRIKQLLLAPDASYFLGSAERRDREDRLQGKTLAFDVATGRPLWSRDFEAFGDSRTGPLAALAASDGRSPLSELPSGDPLLVSPPNATLIGAGRRLAVGTARLVGEEYLGRSVYRIGDDEPIVTLGIDRPMGAAWPQFSLDETRLAWGHPDGTLQIADLPAIQHALARFGLGW